MRLLPAEDLIQAFDYLKLSKDNGLARDRNYTRSVLLKINKGLIDLKGKVYETCNIDCLLNKPEPCLILKIDKIYTDTFGKRNFSLIMRREIIKELQISGYKANFRQNAEFSEYYFLTITW